MTTKLSQLRSQLRLLRWGRRFYRWGAAASAFLAAALATVLVLFAIDVTFEAGIGPRAILLAIASIALVAAFWRLSRPWLFVRESELDIALLVERRAGRRGRSDLPAALQFESPAAAQWGSPQLETAVIDRVAKETSNLDVFAGSSTAPLVRRVLLLLAAALAAGVIAALWPGHVAVFFDRMALGSRHYPTRTAIHAVNINGRVVLEAGSRLARPGEARCAEGEPLWIIVTARGELPPEGVVEVQSKSAQSKTMGQQRSLPLRPFGEKPVAAESNAALRELLASLHTEEDDAAIYLAQLERLMEPLEYQIFLGDAWTDPAEIVMVGLPVIEPKISVTSPDYARGTEKSGSVPAGARQLSVLEGSRIDLEIACVNKKPLAEASLVVTRGGDSERFPLQPADDEKFTWRLPDADSPLSQIAEELRYTIDVRDEDGLSPPSPISGVIRIRADRPPRIAARMVTRVVLPTASPVVNLELADDYGVRRPALELRITRAEGAQEIQTLNDLTLQGYNDDGRLASDTAEFPLTGAELPWRGGCRINLAPLSLAKGDRVTAIFVVSDYRGQDGLRETQAASQPLELEVSDEAGVYRAALEADKQALEDISEAADLQQQLLRSNESNVK
jgi:hypothetical protein